MESETILSWSNTSVKSTDSGIGLKNKTSSRRVKTKTNLTKASLIFTTSLLKDISMIQMDITSWQLIQSSTVTIPVVWVTAVVLTAKQLTKYEVESTL